MFLKQIKVNGPILKSADKEEVKELTLKEIRNLLNSAKNDVVIFIGGAGDRVLEYQKRSFYRYIKEYNAKQAHDIWYSTHNGGSIVAEIVAAYNREGRKVAVIGHSWGGCTAAKIFMRNQKLEADILVTLDPVCRASRPKTMPKGVKLWHNIYVDYDNTRKSISNTVAFMGGRWRYLEVYGKEHNDISWMHGNSEYHHMDVQAMFYFPSNFAVFCEAMAINY